MTVYVLSGCYYDRNRGTTHAPVVIGVYETRALAEEAKDVYSPHYWGLIVAEEVEAYE